MIPGFHAVKESIRNGSIRIKEIWIAKGKGSSRSKQISELAQKKGIKVFFKERRLIDELIPDSAHQGILAFTESFKYSQLEELVNNSYSDSEYALIVAADHITDEGNLGAIIRSAAFFSANGLLIPKDRSAMITETVKKRSSGAYVHLPVARVINLARTLDTLSKKGFWIIGASGEASESIYDFDWNRNTVLVLGNEEKGLGVTIKKQCQQIVKIPGSGNVESLNVSVAAGAILSEIARQRVL